MYINIKKTSCLLLIVLGACMWMSCKHTPEVLPTCDTSNVTYLKNINPIIQSQCISCHTGYASSGGVELSTYDGVKAIALNGKLYGSITHTYGFQAMPQGGNKLSDCQINTINKWINSGAPQN